MIRVSIIGSGNVAQHLIRAFGKATETELVQVFTRNKEVLSHLVASEIIAVSFNEIEPVDVIIIAVADNAIAEVAKHISLTDQLIVHTSGSTSINTLNNQKRKGVFYPLQTFSKSKEIDFSTVPICIEAENETDLKLLETIGRSISKSVYQ